MTILETTTNLNGFILPTNYKTTRQPHFATALPLLRLSTSSKLSELKNSTIPLFFQIFPAPMININNTPQACTPTVNTNNTCSPELPTVSDHAPELPTVTYHAPKLPITYRSHLWSTTTPFLQHYRQLPQVSLTVTYLNRSPLPLSMQSNSTINNYCI